MHDADACNRESNVCLHLGLTDYRSLFGYAISFSYISFDLMGSDDFFIILS